MAFAKLIAFDRPLTGISAPGTRRIGYTEAEILAREDAAYHRGVDASRALADQQMVELRTDIEALGEGVFKRLSAIEPTLLAQLRLKAAVGSLGEEDLLRVNALLDPRRDVPTSAR